MFISKEGLLGIFFYIHPRKSKWNVWWHYLDFNKHYTYINFQIIKFCCKLQFISNFVCVSPRWLWYVCMIIKIERKHHLCWTKWQSFNFLQQKTFHSLYIQSFLLCILRCAISFHKMNTSTKYPSKPMSSSFYEVFLEFLL